MNTRKSDLSLKELPTVRQLRAFCVVYETGSASAAANALALTQPAVTVLLRELEAKLGVRLFDRGPRGLHPTEAAAQTMVYAQRVLSDLFEMRKSMGAFASGKRGELRIAATSAVAQTLLPALLKRFVDMSPEVRVVVDDCSPHELIDRIASERVHLGIGAPETSSPALIEEVFMQDWLYAASHASLLTTGGKTMTWKQLSAQPIITVKPGYGVRRSIDQAAAKAGISLNIVHEVSLLSTALAMAAQGLGIALVPGPIFDHATNPGMSLRRMVRPLVTRNMSVIYKRSRQLPPAAAEFVKLLHSMRRNPLV